MCISMCIYTHNTYIYIYIIIYIYLFSFLPTSIAPAPATVCRRSPPSGPRGSGSRPSQAPMGWATPQGPMVQVAPHGGHGMGIELLFLFKPDSQ